MKKFTKILLCFILCVVTFGLVACGGGKDDFAYPTNVGTTAVGNGGMAVTVGDYLYFVNGFISVDDLSDDDQNGSFTVGSVVIAKLDADGNLVLDEDGLLDDDYYRTISDKLAGFEATGLFAYGEYLYFTTPCQENSKGGTWENGLVDFYRIKLDASSNPERIYQSTVENDSLEFAFYSTGASTYLLVYEQGDESNTLYRVDATKTKKNVETIAENVTSVIMPVDDGVYDYSGNDYANVFYTCQNDDSLYALRRLNVITGEASDFAFSESEVTIEVLGVIQNKYVYVSVERTIGGSTTYNDLYRYDIATQGSVLVLADIDDYDLYFTPDGNSTIAVGDDNIIDIWTVSGNSVVYNNITEDSSITISTFIGFANGCIVYLDSDNSIKMASYSNVIAGGDADIKTLVEDADGDINSTYFDLDQYYVYYYKTVGSNVYLFRVAVNNNDGSGEDEIVGIYETDDIPETEEDEDDTTEE